MDQNPQRDSRDRIIAPSSTDKTIIFPYNHNTKKFNTYHYNPCMTPSNFPTEALLTFLGDIECHIQTYYNFGGFRLKKILTYLGYILGVAFLIAFYTIIFAPIFLDMLSFNPFMMPVLAIALLLYILTASFICCRCNVLAERKLEEAKKNVNLYINERAVDFKQRGLSWIVPAHFPHWIELWKDNPTFQSHSNEANFTQTSESAEMMQMNSGQQVQPVDIRIHPGSQQACKGGYYGLNEESPSDS